MTTLKPKQRVKVVSNRCPGWQNRELVTLWEMDGVHQGVGPTYESMWGCKPVYASEGESTVFFLTSELRAA